MDPFEKTFGKCTTVDGVPTCALETYYLSLLNSLVYIGFAVGKVSLPCVHVGRLLC